MPSTAPPLPIIGKNQSQNIKLARVLCILFMMTTHAWPGSERILAANLSWPSHALLFVVVDIFGRASVPLLSTISGLLLVSSFARRGTPSVILGKFKTLVVPLVFWSIPMAIIAFAEGIWIDNRVPAWTPIEWVNAFFSITSEPANGPLHFFRDIFVMVLYACLILPVFRWNRWAGMALALAIALLEQKAGGFLVFRNQIAVFFIAGLLLTLSGKAEWVPRWPLVAVLMLAYAALGFYGVLDENSSDLATMRFSQLFPRLTVSILMWRICADIAAHLARLAERLKSLEPDIFVVFCSHAITAKFFALLALVAGLTENAWYYPAFLTLQTVVFVMVGWVLARILAPFPWLRGRSRQEKSAKGWRPVLTGLGRPREKSEPN